MKAVEISNLTKKYGVGEKEVIALNNVSMKFSYGKFYLIVGHSGSGKSTLLKIIGLIDSPTKGSVFVSDNCTEKLNNKELALIRNKDIGFIFQEFYLDKYLTAIENVTIPILINKQYENKKQVINKGKDLLINVGLKKRINHYPKELSGGEQQRVCIARALANDPKIILADEPTGNLDVNNEKIIFSKLKELAKDGKCVIMVSHSRDALNYADEVVELEEGVIK